MHTNDSVDNQTVQLKISQHYKVWDIDIIARMNSDVCSFSFELFRKHSNVNNSHTFVVKTVTTETKNELMEIYQLELERSIELLEETIFEWSNTFLPEKEESEDET